MKAVEIKDLYFYYDGHQNNKVMALNGVNLEIETGKKVAVLGANGSGKSTLFYHMNGLYTPQSGRVEILGIESMKSTRRDLIKRVGLVFDNPDNQLFSTTVYDDIAFALRNEQLDEDVVREKVAHLLDLVEATELCTTPPYNLSWGQKKRVAVATTLAMDPEILVLDEPFSGMDPYMSKTMVSLLDKLHGTGKTLLLGTHDVDFAYDWADEIVVLSKGKVVQQGSVELLKDQSFMESVFLDAPLLSKIFAGTSYSPKSNAAAREIVQGILKHEI